jgi:hypothetical protein
MESSSVVENRDGESWMRRRGTLFMRNDLRQKTVSVGSLRYMAFAMISKAAVTRSVAIFWGSIYKCQRSPQDTAKMNHLVT